MIDGPFWEDAELYNLCLKHGTIISKHTKIGQIAILDMYDELLAYINTKEVNVKEEST